MSEASLATQTSPGRHDYRPPFLPEPRPDVCTDALPSVNLSTPRDPPSLRPEGGVGVGVGGVTSAWYVSVSSRLPVPLHVVSVSLDDSLSPGSGGERDGTRLWAAVTKASVRGRGDTTPTRDAAWNTAAFGKSLST